MSIAEYQNLTIIRHTKGRIPVLPFVEIKEAILGKEYELSLVFPTQETSIEIHKTWKKKTGPVNTLAFPFSSNEGEIILTLSQARKEASKYQHTYKQHIVFLFIHSCLHLKGMTHGARMEQYERRFYHQFDPLQ